MLVCSDQIRLTAAEHEQLASITGMDPTHVKTLLQLEDYIRKNVANPHYIGPAGCLARRVLLSYLPTATSCECSGPCVYDA